jgi:hypothetical protein
MTEPENPRYSVAVERKFHCASGETFDLLVDDLSTAWFADGSASTATFDPDQSTFTFLRDLTATDHRDAVNRVLDAVDTAMLQVPDRDGVHQRGIWRITITPHNDNTDTAQENTHL